MPAPAPSLSTAETVEAVDRTEKGHIDLIAVAVSSLCLIHCIASGVAVMLVALIGSEVAHWLGDSRVHLAGFVLALWLALIGLSRGWRVHGRVKPLLLGTAGLTLMGLALVWPGIHLWGEALLTVAGVVMLASAHLMNRRAYPCRTHHFCADPND